MHGGLKKYRDSAAACANNRLEKVIPAARCRVAAPRVTYVRTYRRPDGAVVASSHARYSALGAVTAVVAGKGARPLTEGESGGLLERQPAGDGRVRLARVDQGAQLPDFVDRHGLLRHVGTVRAVDGGAGRSPSRSSSVVRSS